MRLLLLTPAELSRDVRARRAAAAARARGFDVVGLCGQVSGEEPVPLEDVTIVRVGPAGHPSSPWTGSSARRRPSALRELRALFRLARLLPRTGRFWRAGRGLGGVDVVHANDLETLPAAFLLARRAGARFVYDAHELYSDFETPAPRLARRASLRLESALARRADAVVTVSDGIASEMRRRLSLTRMPLIVPNAPPREEVRASAAPEGPLRVIYQGGLGPGRALDDLLEAGRAEGISLAIRIRLADSGELRRAAGERVEVLDPVPPDEAVRALSGFEVGLIFDRPQTRSGELSMPNKLFEYLMAGLAVVAPHLETLGPFVEGERIGATYDPSDPGGLRRALERLARDRAEVGAMQGRARALAETRFNAEAAASVLAEAWNV